jgi:hypothetical protein
MERVAVLEAKMEAVEENQKLMLKKQEEILESLTKYKGFIGGIAFVASCVVTALSFAKEWVINHLK